MPLGPGNCKSLSRSWYLREPADRADHYRASDVAVCGPRALRMTATTDEHATMIGKSRKRGSISSPASCRMCALKRDGLAELLCET